MRGLVSLGAVPRDWPGSPSGRRPGSTLWCWLYCRCFLVQREMLARGASSWPRQKPYLPAGLEAACCQLLITAAFKRKASVLVLAGGCVGRKHALWLGWGLPSARDATVGSSTLRPSQLYRLPPPSVLVLHSWSGWELVLGQGELELSLCYLKLNLKIKK